MAGSDSKRPGVFEDDEQRALREIERRRRVVTPAHGVPVDEFDADQPTPPPQDVNALIRKLWPLRHADEWLTEISEKLGGLDARTENLEKLSGGLSEIGVLRERIVDATGKSGDNGKLGELRRRVDAWTSKMWWFVTALVGMLGTAAVKLVIVTRTFDAVEATGRHNAELIKRQDNEISLLRAEVMAERAARLSRRARDERAPGTTSESREAAAGKD